MDAKEFTFVIIHIRVNQTLLGLAGGCAFCRVAAGRPDGSTGIKCHLN